MKDLKIEMKDDYSQYLFYFVKQYDNPNNPIDYLKIQNLFDILENKENDEKMNTESDIEICEEYVQIITNFTN
jgi:O-glycosyl hydrolase